jgi:hypothetical protein
VSGSNLSGDDNKIDVQLSFLDLSAFN